MAGERAIRRGGAGGAAESAHGDAKAHSSRASLTPMIDVTFLLLEFPAIGFTPLR